MSPEERPEGLPPDFGPYHFLKLLGRGGLGAVYLVRDSIRQGPAVMKIGNPDLDAYAQQRFLEEGKVLAHFDHPNITRLYDTGNLPDGRPFLLTEWLDGRDLRSRIQRGPALSLKEVLEIARSVAAALAYAHARRILHLDVKPENLFVPVADGVERFDQVKLIDFGVRRELEASTNLTKSGFVLGTPYYMSPEQLRGAALNPAADVFSFGAVLYELLSGRRPFEGSNIADVFHQLLNTNPPDLGPEVPQPFARLVFRCLAKDPSQRPTSGTELLASIEAVVGLPDEPKKDAARLRSDISQLKNAKPEKPPTPLPAFQPASSKPAAAFSNAPLFLGVTALCVLVLAGLWLATRFKGADWRYVWLGGFLVVLGMCLGAGVRRYLAGKRKALTGDLTATLSDARTRKALSMTLSLQVDEVLKQCRQMDEKVLGLTMAVMLREYDSARKFDDRQKALMNAVNILEKLGPKLSPWYIRHEKLIAASVSLVGVISGLATAALSVAKIAKGAP